MRNSRRLDAGRLEGKCHKTGAFIPTQRLHDRNVNDEVTTEIKPLHSGISFPLFAASLWSFTCFSVAGASSVWRSLLLLPPPIPSYFPSPLKEGRERERVGWGGCSNFHVCMATGRGCTPRTHSSFFTIRREKDKCLQLATVNWVFSKIKWQLQRKCFILNICHIFYYDTCKILSLIFWFLSAARFESESLLVRKSSSNVPVNTQTQERGLLGFFFYFF